MMSVERRTPQGVQHGLRRRRGDVGEGKEVTDSDEVMAADPVMRRDMEEREVDTEERGKASGIEQ